MKILHIFILCLITVRTLANRTVTAYTGGGINIECSYEDVHKNKIKSFCKIGTQQRCLDQINTEAHTEWTHKGKFSIQDRRSEGIFRVLIRELTVEDTGIYRCAVAGSDPMSTSIVVNLKVTEDLSYEKAISKTGRVGGDININCRYPNSYRREPKFFCKMLHNGVCTYKKDGREAVKEQKISQHDDQAKQVFTVSMKRVSEQNSGEYWCGVEATGESEHGYKVYITRINIAITDPSVPVSKRPSSLSSSSSSSTSSTSTYLLLPTSHPTPSSLLTGTPGFIIMSVILPVLLVLLISFLTVTFCRRMVPIPRTIHEVPSAGTRRLPNTLSSTVQLPTIPADSSHPDYVNTRLPTIPSDFSHTVYATAQLPSLAPDQYVCSTA
ncbi:CMRF35-like molecule 8 [Pangasianodon hypophthalmus]|uniref:CMRF35-like molecule 8 n=1 Tax=Pangasianodon hypophthalmus TaxID=310915 RepID=UPI0023075090|nr:CMRF35-like molecule 8 [Pangasianodon hypophthalmus]